MARKCSIVELAARDTNEFLETSHLQGGDHASIRYGLTHNGELVAVMTFVRSRFDKSFEWELSRYASLPFVTVVGGASRLLHMFCEIHAPRSLITYSDRRHSTGNLYETLGFQHLRDQPPGYTYLVKGIRENRLAWQKHMLSAKLPNFDATLTEEANMVAHGYWKCWDCGQSVYGIQY